MRLMDEVRLLDLPVRSRYVFVVVVNLIAIFEDASDLDTGQVKDLAVELELLAFLGGCLGDQQVFGFSGERNDGAVGVNSAGLDVGNLEVAALLGNLDGGQLLALLGEHLDARVKAPVMDLVVGHFLNVEVDGGCAGSFGVGGHLEFFVGGLMKLC
jgi:hypothetical protein